MTVIIRPASYQDVPALTALTEEMGYPADSQALSDRLTMLLGSPDLHQLWVAEIQGEVAGWLHAFWRPLLDAPAAVEIGGLAISLRWRRHGAGRRWCMWRSAGPAPKGPPPSPCVRPSIATKRQTSTSARAMH